jgi:hypothetical protein
MDPIYGQRHDLDPTLCLDQPDARFEDFGDEDAALPPPVDSACTDLSGSWLVTAGSTNQTVVLDLVSSSRIWEVTNCQAMPGSFGCSWFFFTNPRTYIVQSNNGNDMYPQYYDYYDLWDGYGYTMTWRDSSCNVMGDTSNQLTFYRNSTSHVTQPAELPLHALYPRAPRTPNSDPCNTVNENGADIDGQWHFQVNGANPTTLQGAFAMSRISQTVACAQCTNGLCYGSPIAWNQAFMYATPTGASVQFYNFNVASLYDCAVYRNNGRALPAPSNGGYVSTLDGDSDTLCALLTFTPTWNSNSSTPSWVWQHWRPDDAPPYCNPSCANGICTSDFHCDCPPGWSGPTCAIANCTPSCGPGQCVAPNVCVCPPGYNGTFCEGYSCGTCVHGFCGSPNECWCEQGWEGTDCNTPKCFNDCAGHGKCVDSDVCMCDNGWTALPDCSKPICSDCKHGTCTAPGVCTCDTHWSGEACNLAGGFDTHIIGLTTNAGVVAMATYYDYIAPISLGNSTLNIANVVFATQWNDAMFAVLNSGQMVRINPFTGDVMMGIAPPACNLAGAVTSDNGTLYGICSASTGGNLVIIPPSLTAPPAPYVPTNCNDTSHVFLVRLGTTLIFTCNGLLNSIDYTAASPQVVPIRNTQCITSIRVCLPE